MSLVHENSPQKLNKTSYIENVYLKQDIISKNDILTTDMICRVCTNLADISITDRFGDTLIINAIRTVANISINVFDHYPKYVCTICLEELKIAYKFKKKCEASDMMFKKTISSKTENQASKEPSPQPVVKHEFSILLHQLKQKGVIKDGNSKDDNNLNNEYYVPRFSLSQDLHSISHDNHEEIKTPLNIIRMHKCVRCSLKFKTKGKLQTHQKEGCIERPCPLCGKLVLNLANHEKKVHCSAPMNSIKYSCDQCEKICCSKGSLKLHIKRNHNEIEYLCDHCPYKTKTKQNLVIHMKKHTGDYRFLCAMCPMKFITASNFNKHQLVHSTKKYQCTKCKRSFRQEKQLKDHYDAAHLNIRYRCSICGKDLFSRERLLRHELRIHKRVKHTLFDKVQKVVIGNNDLTSDEEADAP